MHYFTPTLILAFIVATAALPMKTQVGGDPSVIRSNDAPTLPASEHQKRFDFAGDFKDGASRGPLGILDNVFGDVVLGKEGSATGLRRDVTPQVDGKPSDTPNLSVSEHKRGVGQDILDGLTSGGAGIGGIADQVGGRVIGKDKLSDVITGGFF